MKTILVTGGCGYIGSHTCLALLQANYNLIVIDSNINSSKISLNKVIEIGRLNNQEYKKRLTFIQGDIRNKVLLNDIFSKAINKNNRIEAVIHLAGLKAVSKSVKEPMIYWESNVWGSLVLFQIMEKFNCFNIVFSSSATVYGVKDKGYLSEESNLEPSNPYGETKLAIEKILSDIFKSSPHKWRIVNLRYFNPIGAHPSGLIGENPLTLPDNLFPFICKVASRKLSHLNIFGNDWPTFDGTCIRDYIHVMDLAESHLCALEYLFRNKTQNLSLNIGTGKGTSVIELVNTFIKVNNCKVPYKFVNRRDGDVPFVVAENKLSISKLDWSPKRSLIEMCKDGWIWQQNNPEGYK